MVKTHAKFPLGWFVSACFLALGLVIFFCFTAYQFTGLLCMGLGLVIICYTALKALAKNHVTAAKILRLILTTFLLLGILAATVTGVLVGWASVGHEGVSCRYIVVLGAGVDGTTPSLSLRERLDAAYDYLISNPQTICVVSGGQGDGEQITEAECMYLELIRRGIEPERIWQENKATSTVENLRFSLDLIEERTGTRPSQIGLVSSDYHLYRAGLMAEDQDITAIGIPAETSLLHLEINYFLREIAAVWYYCLIG